MSTRWFSSDNDKEGDDKDEKGDENDELDDEGELDFFTGADGEAGDDESIEELYEMMFEGRTGKDYVKKDDFFDAMSQASNYFSDKRAKITIKAKIKEMARKEGIGEINEDAESEVVEPVFFAPREQGMTDPERGVVEARAKYRKAKAKVAAYDKWKDHLFGFQTDQYTEADQLVIHNAPALTTGYTIGLRPTPIWEVLKQNQQYPEDDPGDDDDDDVSLHSMSPDAITSLTPEMQEQMALIDRQFDQSGSFLDEQDNDDGMSVRAFMKEIEEGANAGEDSESIDQELEQKPFFQIENAPHDISEDLGRVFSEEAPSEQETVDVLLSRAGFVIHHIYSDRVSNMTAKGKVHSIRTLVVMGNQHGTAGFATSRAESEEIALDLACKKAVKNLMYLDLYNGNSLHEPLRGKCHSTHALLWPGHPNGGLRVGRSMFAICDSFGIKNMSGKVIGRNNPYAVIPAIFSALLKYRPIEDVALGRGRRMYDLRKMAPRYMMGF